MAKYRIVWVESSGFTHFAQADTKSEARRLERSIINRYGDQVDCSYIEIMEDKTNENSNF